MRSTSTGLSASDDQFRLESPTTDPDAARRAVNPDRPEPYPPADDQDYVRGESVRSGF